MAVEERSLWVWTAPSSAAGPLFPDIHHRSSEPAGHGGQPVSTGRNCQRSSDESQPVAARIAAACLSARTCGQIQVGCLGRQLGRQLQEQAPLDVWLRDDFAAYVAALCVGNSRVGPHKIRRWHQVRPPLSASSARSIRHLWQVSAGRGVSPGRSPHSARPGPCRRATAALPGVAGLPAPGSCPRVRHTPLPGLRRRLGMRPRKDSTSPACSPPPFARQEGAPSIGRLVRPFVGHLARRPGPAHRGGACVLEFGRTGPGAQGPSSSSTAAALGAAIGAQGPRRKHVPCSRWSGGVSPGPAAKGTCRL